MDFDFESAIEHLSKDSKLKSLIDTIVLPDRSVSKDVYAGLIQSIVSQQLSVKAANTIHNRFLSLFPTDYPNAEVLLELNEHDLRSAGLSRQKSTYVQNVAMFFKEHNLFNRNWDLDSDDQIISMLTQIKGVGKWTVQMILMFELGREDVFPVLDLGIQQGIKQVYGLKEDKKELLLRIEEIADPWKPFRSVACLYLWASKDMK